VEESVKLIVSLIVVCAFARIAYADDKCRLAAEEVAKSTDANAHVIYWDGTKRVDIKGANATGDTIYLYAATPMPTLTNLGLAAGTALPTKPVGGAPAGCKDGIVMYKIAAAPAPIPPSPKCLDGELIDLESTNIAAAYTKPRCNPINANGAMSIAAEAVQILGQIVVDRASQQAYTLITNRAKIWLDCADKKNRKLKFKATCRLLDDLRLQDLAMAPDRLRAALIEDAMSFIDIAKEQALGVIASIDPISSGGAMRVVLASYSDGEAKTPAPKASSTGDCANATAGGIDDVLCTIKRAVIRRITPLLSRLPSSVGGYDSEVLVRDLLDKGIGYLGAGAKQWCTITEKPNRILATAASAFALCKLQKTDCAIMDVVNELDSKCTGNQLDDYELSHARSIAGHFWDAVTLKKDFQAGDPEKRLIAALEGTFEVGCMYATTTANSTDKDPYVCELVGKPGDPLAKSESLAIMRDIVLAGAHRDGTGVAAAFIRALTRGLKPAEDKDQTKALRLLSTITAYAATYTTTDGNSKDAHARRTALLESLTKDMTDRTDRDGDKIASIGGSLRIVGGWRIGRKRRESGDANNTFHDDALAAPLSLPLGFAVDRVETSKRRGWHLEVGVLDLGQYLSLDKNTELAEPDLITAFSPSLTLAASWGKELPMFFGATAGYTPGFDFDPDNDKDKKGAWHIGLTAGIYVPLFDFN
jgi:hypothetical protein